MEAITKNGSHFHAFVHCRQLNSSSFIPVRYLNFPRKPVPKSLAVTKANLIISDHDDAANRPLFQFPPSLLDDRFRSLSVNQSEMDVLGRDLEALVPRVRDKLVCSDAKERILLIHTLVSLGVAYHFEKEIEEFLEDAFETVEDMIIGEDDMYTISVIFRVFRLYGHNVSSDMFNKFKGEDGKFKKKLIKDVRGMLSLYEASYFGTTTEEILDEAMSFTRKHLEQFVGSTTLEPHMSTLLQSVLYLSQLENEEAVTAREYIRFYEQEKHHDEMLLKLAKLNFKFMQLHYRKEIQILVKWWDELDLESKVPNYFRERVVECFFWATGVYMEPQYSLGRIILAKFAVFLTIIDDAADAYCTLTEITGFVECLERWEADTIDTLPDHLKIVLGSLIKFFEELKGEMRPQERVYSVQYTIEEVKRLFRGNLAVATWARTRNVPNFDEYMEAALVTGGVHILVAGAFIGMGEIAGRDAYEWVVSRSKLIQILDLKARLTDDVATYKDEMDRGEIATGINCYMKQYGVTKEEAFLEFESKIRHTSKLLNEEFLRISTNSVVPRKIARVAFNFIRVIDTNYKHGDGFTYTEMKKDQITSLYIDLVNH